MKKYYILLTGILLLAGVASAQTYNFDAIAAGSTGTLSNGWVGAPTTDFSWIADNNGTPSGGTGPAVDHTLGNATGIYMYTEASSPAAPGDVATLTSPSISLVSFTNPGLSFWYHKAGNNMGDLYIDVFDGTNWILAVDSIMGTTQADPTSNWLNSKINLGSFSGTIQVRFRAICGPGFASDMAIDDVELIEIPDYDISALTARFAGESYHQIPASQIPYFDFQGTIENTGAQSVTNPQLKVTIGAQSDSISVSSLASGVSDTLTIGNSFTLPSGAYSALFEASIDETDTVPSNDSATMDFIVSDSIYAYDDSVMVGTLGIGAGTAGILGQTFEFFEPDTLTSASFFLNAPTVGDTFFISLHPFNGTPGAEIAITDTFIIPSATPSWYTLPFECPIPLDSGTYFLGANEFDQNITIGTTPLNYSPEHSWVIFGTNPWQPAEFYGFPVAFLLRANLANVSSVAAGTAQNDSICASSGAIDLFNLLSGNDSGGTWSDDNTTGALNGSMFDPSGLTASTYAFTYTVNDSCGFSESATVNVTVEATPEAGADASDLICNDANPVDLSSYLSGADPGGSWVDLDGSGALNGSMFDPNGLSSTYTFAYVVSGDACEADSAFITMVVDPCMGIDEATQYTLLVYPNPSNGHFVIDSDQQALGVVHLQILDISGRVVLEQTTESTSGIVEVDASHLSHGNYIVRMTSQEMSFSGMIRIK